MHRTLIALVCAVTLTACTGTTAPSGSVSAPTASASGGQAARLRPGMTENDAFAVFGPESGFERNPADFDESCLSYAYGDATAPRYVHARFRSGALMQATEGHATLCTYADPVPAL